MRLIDADALYEKASDLEAQALDYAVKISNDEEKREEWIRWSAILAERTAFRHDVYDAPTIEPERKTQWISCDDKVPIVSGEFLVTLTDADGEWVSTAEWNTTFGGRWQDIFPDDGYRDISNVIAWMPLPESYEGGNDA